MTATPKTPQRTRLYQPPLPWTADPALGTAARKSRPGPSAPPRAATGGGRTATDARRAGRPASRPSTGPALAPRRAVSYGDWRLDENTRRAGRQGVAAARAALAGTTRPSERRQANAA